MLMFLSLAFGSNKPLIDSAEIAYKKGNYKKAIINYQKILASGIESSQLYYNMGNCYYRLNEVAQSILYYEKAHKLKPNDEDIIYNITVANQKIVDKINALPLPIFQKWFNLFSDLLSSNQWAWLSLIFFIIIIILIGFYLYGKTVAIKKIGFYIAIVFTLLLIISLSTSFYQDSKINEKFGIITQGFVKVNSTPDENSQNLFNLHEGIKVNILNEEVKGWYEIRIADGNIGWVKTETLEQI